MFSFRTNRYVTLCFLTVIVVLSGACESEDQPATFYPIDSLVSSQVDYLAAARAKLFKEAFLQGTNDSVTYIPSDTAWRKELEIFAKLNEINKPVNRNNYEVKDGLLDTGSNLTVKSFNSLKDLPVVYLKIYYHGSIRKPRKIEALYDERNLLFKSARLLSMHFQQLDGRTVLTSYAVKGGQQMMFGDSVSFIISGKVFID